MHRPLGDNEGGAAPVELGLVIFLAGSALAILSIYRESRLGQWIRGFVSAGNGRTSEMLRRRLHGADQARLRQRLLGRSRAHVAAAIGIPQTAASMRAGQINESIVDPHGFWRAQTWYYPLNPGDQSGVAIHFHDDHVVEVESITSPVR